jgi:predicted dehydrogenase
VSAPRIAVAGAGLIGQQHIEEIAASSAAELASIVDPFPAAAEVTTSRRAAAGVGSPAADRSCST